jgi:hypothetical protein
MTHCARPNFHIVIFEALNKKIVYARISEVGPTTVATLDLTFHFFKNLFS